MELDRRRLLQMGSSSIACMAVGDLCSRRSRAEGLAGETTAWLDAKILLGESQAGTAVLDRGTLVIRGSKIIAVGRTGEVAIPEGTKTIDAGGQWIMPGLVCTHSHIGGGGAADGSSPIQPGVRILDSINVRDSGFKR
ncbi:MAG: hypothetical protein ACK52S_02035, partial [Pirellula sp.]